MQKRVEDETLTVVDARSEFEKLKNHDAAERFRQ